MGQISIDIEGIDVFMIYVLLVIQSLLLITGQTLWKTEIDKYTGITLNNITQILFSWRVVLGLSIYVAATLLWFYIISIAKDKFSVIYPFGSLAYVLGIFVAIIFFKEVIPVTRWVGAALVVLGIIFIAK